jgi:hypothetical protein
MLASLTIHDTYPNAFNDFPERQQKKINAAIMLTIHSTEDMANKYVYANCSSELKY